ncbi:MAG: NAD(P)-binding protein, partial [Planctomycetota bacterium]
MTLITISRSALVMGRAAAASGADVLLVEQTAHWGGRALVETDTAIGGQLPADYAASELEALEAM